MRFWPVALLFVSIAMPACGQEAVSIAMVGPMTGPRAEFGEPMIKGQLAAIRRLNESGGILGRKIDAQVFDTACMPRKSEEIAKQIVARGITTVIGYACSGSVAAAAPAFASASVIMITVGAQGSFGASKRQTLFRLAPPVSRQLTLLAQFLGLLKGQEVTVMAAGDKNYYESSATQIVEMAKAAGNKVSKTILLNPKADAAATARAVPEGFGSAVSIVTAPPLLSQQAVAALRTKRPDTVAVVLNYFSLDALAGSLVPGTLVVSLADPRQEKSAAETIKWLRVADAPQTVSAFYGYAGVEIWAAAVRDTRSLDNAKLASRMRHGAFDTTLGPISFGENGDARESHYGFFSVDSKRKAKAVTSYDGRPPPPPPPPPNPR